MTDFVNDHISRHRAEGKPVVPRITCVDGSSISVQASEGHYCSPRDDAGPWSKVEVGYPSGPNGGASRPRSFGLGDHGIYGWVPVEAVNRWIAKHGGPA